MPTTTSSIICTNGINSNGVEDVGTIGICTNGVAEDDGEVDLEAPDGDGLFRLTLTMQGLGEVQSMRVFIIEDDVLYSRETAPFSDNQVSFRATSNENPDIVERVIAAGRQVTLIAIEAKGITADVPLNNDSFPSPFHFEFVGWLGDTEDGVATLVMDGDKDVTVMFRTMPVVDIIKKNENNAQLTGGCYDFTIDVPPLLALPTDIRIDGTREGSCSVRSVQQVKMGTVITLTAEDTNGYDVVSGMCFENFERWEDDASPCGSNRECTFQVDADMKVTAVWRDNR
ncbi:MAG: hypothetical protein GXP29_04875 [Planctomycetes bacterium]|nr:hypothetical protein [Planctomycetota bacterium]